MVREEVESEPETFAFEVLRETNWGAVKSPSRMPLEEMAVMNVLAVK